MQGSVLDDGASGRPGSSPQCRAYVATLVSPAKP